MKPGPLVLLLAIACATALVKPREEALEKFAGRPSAERHRLLREAAASEKEKTLFAEASRDIIDACALPEATDEDFVLRLEIDSLAHAQRDALLATTAMARRGSVKAIDYDFLISIIAYGLGMPGTDPVRFDFLDALFDARFKTRTGAEPDWIWKELAVSLVERGDSRKAATVVARISGPYQLIALRADNRFAAIVAAAPARFDVSAMLTQRVDEARAGVRRNPRSLQAVMELCRALNSRGRYREALDLADQAVTRSSSADPYDDAVEMLPWVRNQRAGSLWALGRWQESIDELRRAQRLDADGGPDVNHALNLAGAYIDLGMAQEALATLKPVTIENTSPFGMMQAERVRAIASDLVGDLPAMERSLSYLREHHENGESALQIALLAVGRIEESAQLLKRRLEDRWLRSDALADVQEFEDLPRPPSPQKWFDNEKTLMDRDDVKAAVAKMGRIEHYDFPSP